MRGESSGMRYTIVTLATDGESDNYAHDLNDAGMVVGWLTPDEREAYAVTYYGAELHRLGTLHEGAPYSAALAVNNLGQVVGRSDTAGGGEHAFSFIDNTMYDLGTLGGGDSAALDVNDNGHIVGWSWIGGDRAIHAFHYDGVEMRDLTPVGVRSSTARSINNSRRIVGEVGVSDGTYHAFLYDATSGILRDLGTLPDCTYSSAFDINEHGHVVGGSFSSHNYGRAFLYDGDTMQDLGTLPGCNYSVAGAINNRGQVVGWTIPAIESLGPLDRHYPIPFIWQNGAMFNLNHVIPQGSDWLLTEARAINDTGQITGIGLYRGQVRGFLMSPQ